MFVHIPNGFGALSKVPAVGWAQVIGYGTFVEISAGAGGADFKNGTQRDVGFKVCPRMLRSVRENYRRRLPMVAWLGWHFGMLFQERFRLYTDRQAYSIDKSEEVSTQAQSCHLHRKDRFCLPVAVQILRHPLGL